VEPAREAVCPGIWERHRYLRFPASFGAVPCLNLKLQSRACEDQASGLTDTQDAEAPWAAPRDDPAGPRCCGGRSGKLCQPTHSWIATQPLTVSNRGRLLALPVCVMLVCLDRIPVGGQVAYSGTVPSSGGFSSGIFGTSRWCGWRRPVRGTAPGPHIGCMGVQRDGRPGATCVRAPTRPTSGPGGHRAIA
jgi:hypothetical protein